MSGFNPNKSDLQRLGRALSGDASQAEKQQVQADLSDEISHMNRFLRGLRELPTSLLAIALESSLDRSAVGPVDHETGQLDAFDETGLRRVIEDVVSSFLDNPETPFAGDNRTIIDRTRGHFIDMSASPSQKASFFEAAGRILESVLVELSRRRLQGGPNLDQPASAISETVAASGQTTLALSLNRPGEVLARQTRLSRLETHDASLARIYVLYTFAGRTHQEIAELLDMDVSNVVNSEEVATVEVCMEDT